MSLSSNAGACRWCRSLELLKSSCTQDCSCPSSVSLELFESSFSRLLCLGCCVISREGGIEKRETCTFRIYCTRTVLVMAIFWWAGEGYYLTKQLEEQWRWRQLRPQRSKISKEDHLFCKWWYHGRIQHGRGRKGAAASLLTWWARYFSLGLQQEKQEEGNAAWMKHFPKTHQLSIYICIFRTFTFCPGLGSDSSSFTPARASKWCISETNLSK